MSTVFHNILRAVASAMEVPVVVCLLLASRMTKLQNTIFLAISICGVCAMVPGVICLLFTGGWLDFPPVLGSLRICGL